MKSMIKAWNLLVALALRDVKVRYSLSILGIYWAIINPFLMALVWGFVFNHMFRAQGIDGVPYLVFLFAGITFWNFFSNSITSSTSNLVGAAAMLSKVSFQRVIIPTSSVVARFVDLVFSLIVLIILMIYYHLPIYWTWFWIPLLLAIQFLFILGLSYMISSINVFYRDVSQIIGVLLTMWMYVSPVLYTIEQIPPNIREYFKYNPIGQLVQMEVKALLAGSAPHSSDLIITTGICLVTFLIGYVVFKKLEDRFAEVM